jgi:AcrR family transcriptional regulator
VDLLVERGYAGATVGAVAARAGVGTKTIYRRFANRDEMLLASISDRVGMISFENTGDTFVDLVSMLGPGGRGGVQRYRVLLGSAIALESGRHPEFLMELRRRFVWPFRRSVESVLARAVRRGEVRDDVDVSVVVDLLLGASSSRFWSGMDFERGLVTSSIAVVLGGCMKRGVSECLDSWVGR